MDKKIPSPENTGEDAAASLEYSRREAVKALAKYSAALGGAATVVVTAEGLVSEASAYGSGGTKKGRRRRMRRRIRRMRRMGRMRRVRRLRRRMKNL